MLLIPDDKKAGFVCSRWQPGDPTVAALILGAGYQVVCHLGKADKCVGVKRSFGHFVGCDQDLCVDFLDGAQIQDCGGGSRVGGGLIELADGRGTITVVSYHGTSGISPADTSCRVAQVEQIFVDLDGEPAVNGQRNSILGDFDRSEAEVEAEPPAGRPRSGPDAKRPGFGFNTDPYRVPVMIDPSAARWLDFVGMDKPFWFVTEAGVDATPTYAGGLNIDHIVSDSFDGECEVPGITQGVGAVYENVYFDHKPHVCVVTER